jgi:hypothetical protein
MSMTFVWVAFLMVTGALFGLAALSVDIGYSVLQVRAMQNGADAAVMAATKALAGSIAINQSPTVYTLNNGALHAIAVQFASYNRPASLASSDYSPVAVEYIPCPDVAAASANWTFDSDPDIVNEVQGAVTETTLVRVKRQSTATVTVPAPPGTCGLRVFTRVEHHALFASALGYEDVRETARATARIFPSSLSNTFSNIWPITRWICNGADDDINDVSADNPDDCDDEQDSAYCQFDPNNPQACTFWKSNADPGGDFKNYVDFSRFSGFAKAASPSITREQHLGTTPANLWTKTCAEQGPSYCPVNFDPSTPPGSVSGGNNDKNKDVPYWIRNGWKGTLNIDKDACHPEVNATLNTPTLVSEVLDPAKCTNSRLELHSGAGDLGNNIAEAMEDYIRKHKQGTDLYPTVCGTGDAAGNAASPKTVDGVSYPGLKKGDWSSVTVFFWRWGEQDTTNTSNSIALNEQSVLWGYYKDSEGDQTSRLKRIIAKRAANFQFCAGKIEGSQVSGFFVTFLDDAPPACSPSDPNPACYPNSIANSISLVE